jgi:hypothetical protein
VSLPGNSGLNRSGGGISKGKKLSLFLTKHYATKTYWGEEVYIHAFLISALDGGEWSASRHGRFTLEKRAPPTVPIGY